MKVHELKTVQPWFDDVYKGVKKFEVRKNDRKFSVGDYLLLREFSPTLGDLEGGGTYGEGFILCRVTYILEGFTFAFQGNNIAMGIEIVAKDS